MARLLIVKSDAVEDVPALKWHVRANVKGYVADTEMTFTYQNPKYEACVAQFQFPMLDGAALYYFQARFLDRIIEAECQELSQAEETYRDAVESRKTAFLLRQHEDSGDIFRCDLGNIPPQARVTLKLKYAQELSLEAEGGTSLTIPTVMRKRYNPHGPAAHQGPTLPSAGPPGNLERPRVSVELRVDPAHTTKSIECKNYTATVDRAKDSIKVYVDDCAANENDIRFKIRYEDEFEPSVIMETGSPDTDNFMSHPVLMVSMVPELTSETLCEQREFVFVVDQSGSMRGERINCCKETLLFCLKSLPVGCYFNIVGFGGTFHSCFPESKEYSEDSLAEAIAFQRNIKANMGCTNMLAPLTSVFSIPAKAPRQILIMTDGAITNQSQVLNLVKDNAKTSRTFSFGIGEGVSTSLVEGLARAGGGKAEYISEPRYIKTKVLSSLQCAMQPALENIKLDWVLPAGVEVMQFPLTPSVVFAGHSLIVYAMLISKESPKKKLDISSLQGAVVLKATSSEGSNLNHTLSFDLANSDTSATPHNLPLHRLTAKAQLQDVSLEVDQGSSSDVMILTSLASNVVCKHTAFVAVDKTDAANPAVVTGATPRDSYAGVLDRAYSSYGSCDMVLCCDSTEIGLRRQTLSCADPLQTTRPPNILASRALAPRKKRGFSIGLPSLSGVGRNIAKGFQNLSGRRRSASAIPTCRALAIPAGRISDATDSSLVGAASAPKVMSPPIKIQDKGAACESFAQTKDKVTAIVDLQSFDGSWRASKELSDLLALDVILTENKPVKDETVWATALVMAWLRLNQIARKAEWILLEEKTRRWLATRDLEGASVEGLITLAEKALQN